MDGKHLGPLLRKLLAGTRIMPAALVVYQQVSFLFSTYNDLSYKVYQYLCMHQNIMQLNFLMFYNFGKAATW